MERRLAPALLLPLCLLAGCEDSLPGATLADDGDAAERRRGTAIYAPTGAEQCGDAGVSLAVHRRQLEDANIRVHGAYCGHDGFRRIQVCGAGTGQLNVFIVPPGHASKAEKLGFGQVSQLPSFMPTDCPPPPEKVQVYRPTGQLQCEPVIPLDHSIRLAEEAGVPVLDASCGSDHLMRPAVCGAGTGNIHILDIPPGDVQDAIDAGFAPVETLGGRITYPC